MRTRTKVHVDRLVGMPLAWSLNLAARLLATVWHRDHSISEKNVRTVAFAKYVGMGSIIQTTPLIRSIKASFPQARVIFVTGRGCRVLVERLEHVDAIITVDDRDILRAVSSSLRAIAALVRARVDLFFDLEVYSAYASSMSLLSLARNRIGFYRESAEHKIGIYTHLMYFNTRCPIRYIYLQLARAVGCAPVDPDRLGRIRIEAADREELAALGLERGRYLVINPNASDLMVERRWPADRFAALIGQMIKRFDLPVVLIGSPAEREYVAGVVEEVPGRVLNLAGKLSLGAALALLEQARCVITNDTGPMHIAWALGTPTVCLFGPGDPTHYGWAGPDVEILYERVYCSPCLYETDEPPCGGNNICMQRITVDQVLASVQRILDAPTPHRLPNLGSAFFVDRSGKPLGRVIRGSIEAATHDSGT